MKTICLPDLNIWRNKIDNVIRQINRLSNGTEVTFNMENNAFIKPQGSIMLTLLCKRIFDITNRKVCIEKLKTVTHSQLQKIKFFNYPFAFTNCKLNYTYRNEGNNNLFIDTELINICDHTQISFLIDKVKRIVHAWFPKTDINTVLTIITELCNNSIEHSRGYNKTGECFCVLQKYVYSGKTEISICIGDIGIGVRQHLRLKHLELYDSDLYCLEKVLDGLSGRQDSSGGLGILYVKNEICKFKGQFSIRSGKGMIEVNESKKRFKYEVSFPGTQSLIVLE